ncbi:MAG TPA: ABC transporter ATP-binding protein [Elusimicrobiota bacterium]|nr:ABC transporter ATP-binding protein [Elusimicrobiota bacterium]
MRNFAVLTENVGKKFDIGTMRQKMLGQQFRYWVQGHQPTRSFWALRNVSFRVEHGEGLGVIGPNGSGKSTLLRILSGILQPNEGRVESNGPVNPFLALGVSLLPQLTVMQNLKLCAALLGYTGREFRRKLDSIIEFSELSDYLYAAVADLSVGWASRVAFSIAIHADLNILLVDETLEVGDAYFREKCKRFFRKIKEQGKTIILVSHSMDDIVGVCDKAVYIDGGRQMAFGDVPSVITKYENTVALRMKKTAEARGT